MSLARTNLDRTVLRHLDAGNIATMVPADDVRASQIAESSWIRVSFHDINSGYTGRIGGNRATRIARRLIVECYVRIGVAATETPDAAQQLADQVVARLRYVALSLLDLVTDPTGATPLSGLVRALQPPSVTSPPQLEGYARRLVEVDFTLLTTEA